MTESLDERFSELRRSVDCEIERVKRELIEGFIRLLTQMRSASDGDEWNAAVADGSQTFAGDPQALELLEILKVVAPAPVKKPAESPAAVDLRAQRFARVKIAEIQLYQAHAVRNGRAARDLYGSLQPHIDAAREAFRERFLTPGQEVSDYLHVELVRELANDDATLLGPGYPGPMA